MKSFYRKRIALVVISAFYLLGLSAQSTFTNPFKEADKLWAQDKENYCSPIRYLEQVEEDSLSKFEKNIYYDASATYHSIVSDFEQTIRFDLVRRRQRTHQPEPLIDATFGFYRMSSAKEEIVKLAREHDVIMINESHHTPYHRSFVSDLLPELQKLGYNYLALEALSHEQKINERKYPCFEDGFYTREPLFGEMIRRAVALDYKLVAYEAQEKCDSKKGKKGDRYYCQRFRDSLQAVNIYRIMEQDDKARIVVLAGYSHIKKKGKPNRTRMASYYKRLSGVTPLSIDQTTMMDFGDANLLDSYYQHAFDSLPNEPIVYVDEDGYTWSHSSRVDVTVFSPKLSKIDNRYSFYKLPGKVAHSPQIDDERVAFVQAFYEKEAETAVPADQYFKEEDEKCLYLYPGSYRIQFRDASGALLFERTEEIR
ncbi:MAG: hypothetical protein AAFV95_14720 [Bacteroidota bacterium]